MKILLFIFLLLIPVSVYAQFGGDGAYGSVSGYLGHVNVNINPAADNLYSLGNAGKRWASVSSVTYYGDGSNLTGISSPWTRTGTNVTLTNSGDNVGVGSVTPGQKLDVTGAIRASSDIKIGANSVCQSDSTNCPAGSNVWTVVSGSGASAVLTHTGNIGIGGSQSGDPGVPFYVYGADSTGNGYFSNFVNSDTSSNGITRLGVHCKNSNSCGGSIYGLGDDLPVGGKGISLYSDISGGKITMPNANVGIMTTLPGSTLSVNGNASFGSYATTAAPVGGIIASGNVGVGTNSPNVPLSVAGSGTDLIRVTRTSSGNGVLGISGIADTYDMTFEPQANDGGVALRVKSSGGATSTAMMLRSTGNVGMGSVNPGALLDIAGKFRITTGGHSISTGTAPTVSNNDCGSTSQGTIAAKSTDNSGTVTVGTLTVTSCAITFASSWTNAPNCVVVDDTSILTVRPGTVSTTKLTINSTTSMSGDNITWVCQGNE